MPRKLLHRLRAERRRYSLSQADLAALLGSSWKGRVSWYERGAVPPTEIALTYEVIFGRPVAELLGGRYDELRAEVKRRARELLAREPAPSTPRRARRREFLERIAA